MAKVIVRGVTPKEMVAKHTCAACESVVVYERSDVKCDQRDGNWVVCPVCTTHIAANSLVWGPPCDV